MYIVPQKRQKSKFDWWSEKAKKTTFKAYTYFFYTYMMMIIYEMHFWNYMKSHHITQPSNLLLQSHQSFVPFPWKRQKEFY